CPRLRTWVGLFKVSGNSLIRQLTPVIFAKLSQARPHPRFPVIGIGPWPGLELAAPKEQGNLREHAVAQIDAVGLVLRGCQHELPQGQKPRIEIKWPWLGE